MGRLIHQLRIELPTRGFSVNYPEGYTNINPGDRGTVDFVDDMGTIHVDWDNGSTLGLVSGEDRYRFID